MVKAKNKEYWTKRFNDQLKAEGARGAETNRRIQAAYERAAANVEKELAAWYARFAEENGVSMVEARKLLSGKDLKAFRMDVEEYIEKGRKTAGLEGPEKDALIRELKQASAKVHVSRLEAMQLRMRVQAEQAAGVANAELRDMAAAVYEDSYYRTAYEVQVGSGVGFEFAQLDNAKVQKIISAPWAADEKNFSDRIWSNKAKLVNELQNTFTLGIIQGKSLDKMTKDLAARMDVSKSNAARLVATENAFFSSAGQRDSFKALGVESYEVVATLDSLTSVVCQGLDGKVIPMKDFKPGVTAPPFHPNCRCTTVPYFDDEFTENEKRAARDGNDSGYVKVPSTMKYPEWKDQFVGVAPVNSPSGGLGIGPEGPPERFAPQDWVRDDVPFSVKKALEGTNPNLIKDPAHYSINCQRCVYAYELRRRGYHVIARGASDLQNDDFRKHEMWRGAFKNQVWDNCPFGKDSVLKRMNEFGDGSRAVVYVQWNKKTLNPGETHVFIAEQIKGVTHFFDPQYGRKNVEYYFTLAEERGIMVSRIDNLEPSSYIKYCCEKGD